MKTFDVVFLHNDLNDLKIGLTIQEIEPFVELIQRYGFDLSFGTHLIFGSFAFDESGVFYLTLENEE